MTIADTDVLIDYPAASEIETDLSRKGLGIATPDSLIAGIIGVSGAAPPTRTQRHFELVPGIIFA
jgi:predicted nucleic acid-binding protein